jgi:hypothetical protein
MNSAGLLFGPSPRGRGPAHSQKRPKSAHASGASWAQLPRTGHVRRHICRWLTHDEVFAEGMRKLRGWHRARPKGWRLTMVLDRNDEGWEAVVLLTKDGGRLRRLRRKHHHRAGAVAGGGHRSSCSSRARRGEVRLGEIVEGNGSRWCSPREGIGSSFNSSKGMAALELRGVQMTKTTCEEGS